MFDTSVHPVPVRWRVVRDKRTMGYVGLSSGAYHYEWGNRRTGFYRTMAEAIDALLERLPKKAEN